MDSGSDPERSDRGSLPDRVGGKYRVVRAIASGGMGAVYEVEHEGTGEHLALKVLRGLDGLDPVAIERFRREARVHARLKNEHIVRVIDADVAVELGGAPYLVMDLLEGRTLGDAVSDEPMAPERVLDLLAQIASAIDQAHRAGIVHRDLKPDNLFLTQRPDGSEMVKILDFGIAKFRDGSDTTRTATGALIGTPLYMAREQAAGEHELVGPASDVWSMGMIAFRLLVGRDYWTAGNVSLLLADIVSKPVQAPSKRGSRLGEKFDAWFLRSCAQAPADRFESVVDQVHALARALALPEPTTLAGKRVENTLAISSEVARAASSATDQSLSGSVASAKLPAPAARPSWRAIALGALGLIGLVIAASVWKSGTAQPETHASALPAAARPSVRFEQAVVLPSASSRPAAAEAPAVSSADAGSPKVHALRPPRVPPRPSADPLAEPK